jgi:hypothetical protein
MVEKVEAMDEKTSPHDRGPEDGALQEFRHFIVHLTLDTAKNLALLAALSVIFLAAGWLGRLGMDEKEIGYIQKFHFWITFAVLAWIGIVFFVTLIRRSLR